MQISAEMWAIKSLLELNINAMAVISLCITLLPGYLTLYGSGGVDDEREREGSGCTVY